MEDSRAQRRAVDAGEQSAGRISGRADDERAGRRNWRQRVIGDGDRSIDTPRIDDPLYEIDGADSLCDPIPTEPSLSFVQWDLTGDVFEDGGLSEPFDPLPRQELYAAALTEADDLERIDRPVELINDEGESEYIVEETDFTSEAILVIEAGYRTRGTGGDIVTSSITPQVSRIETTDDGIRAYGCYRTRSRFNEGTTETTLVRFDRPDTLESALVSLTLSEDERLTFSTDDGSVTLEDGKLVDEDRFPWVDEPVYELTEPSCDDDGRDPHWLCDVMPGEPSLAFEQETTSRRVLRDEGVTPLSESEFDFAGGRSQYYVALLTDKTDLERVDRELGGNAVDLLAETDFSTEAGLVVQAGWGSSSTPPHVQRLEATDDGVRAYGCHANPCDQTDDITIRTVAARFERPETLEWGAVSLLLDPETRVNVMTSDGVVTLEDGEIA